MKKTGRPISADLTTDLRTTRTVHAELRSGNANTAETPLTVETAV
jgi:hypothetical protein